MNRPIIILLAGLLCAIGLDVCHAQEQKTEGLLKETSKQWPIGKPGLFARYENNLGKESPKSVVRTLNLTLGDIEKINGATYQWLNLHATKANGEIFQVWLLCETYPSPSIDTARKTIARYILMEGTQAAIEFKSRYSGEAVLPCLGGWNHLFPHAPKNVSYDGDFPKEINYLGHSYTLVDVNNNISPLGKTTILDLTPDTLIGVPHNTRQKDETRLYDESDYELIRLTKSDYNEMIEAGMTCFRVDAEQLNWIERRNVYYWGIAGKDILYPESLYRSNYLGPDLFLDEPAVCVRDHVIRPRFAKDPEFRKTVTPQIVFEEFKKYFHKKKYEGGPTDLLRGLAARPDVDVGDMEFLQENIYTWETMASTAIHQLGESIEGPPASIVFEPPGRFGTLRVLPEMNMSYGCQIPADNPKNFISIIYGLLRGATKHTNKKWGTSIYGAVSQTDAFWFFTHAYDLGAQYFFFWDSYQLACVPYGECLALTRNLRNHIESHPTRNLEKLTNAAETIILFPPGYNLGHVHMGRGNLWGLNELNLERKNKYGIKYRTVMSNLFAEIERCIRLGIAFDLLWDLDGIEPTGYREIVRIREDGKIQIQVDGNKEILDKPRTPARPDGAAPQLTINLSNTKGKAPLEIKATAEITEGPSPVYYTLGTNAQGIYKNIKVCWELFGPAEEDYNFPLQGAKEPTVYESCNKSTIEFQFKITQPGDYRLRAATGDLAGRTSVVWKTITVKE